jgi:hypothetical protein
MVNLAKPQSRQTESGETSGTPGCPRSLNPEKWTTMSTEVLVCIFNEAHTGQAIGHPHMCENWKGNCKRAEIPRLCKIAHIQFQNGMALNPPGRLPWSPVHLPGKAVKSNSTQQFGQFFRTRCMIYIADTRRQILSPVLFLPGVFDTSATV